MDDIIPESFARGIFERAIREERCAEVLSCLFDGGSVTIDPLTDKIVLATFDQLEQLFNG